MQRKIITREMLLDALNEDPDTTLLKLGARFKCNWKTVDRALKEHGLRTKAWTARKHSNEAKQKMSATAIASGRYAGEKNPNFGNKERPWLEGENHPWSKWHKANPNFGESQRGENNPVHRVIHLYQDPNYIQNITRGLRASNEANKGRSYEAIYGDEKSEEIKEKLRIASPRRMAMFARKVTKPEQIVAHILSSLGIEYETQYAIGYYTVDFFVPGANLVIQADGDFWHANPKNYPTPETLSEVQTKQQRKDKACNTFLRNKGFKLLRIWENDLYKQPEYCAQLIRDQIGNEDEQDM